MKRRKLKCVCGGAFTGMAAMFIILLLLPEYTLSWSDLGWILMGSVTFGLVGFVALMLLVEDA